MQAPQVDSKIAAFILDSQATDLMRIVRNFQRQGKKSDYTAKIADDESLFAAFVFKPRTQVLDLDGLPESFQAQVKPFNILGLIRERDGQGGDSGRMMLDLLGGCARPFSSLKSAVELRKELYPGSVLTFANHLLRCRGLEKDVTEYAYEEFMKEMRDREQSVLAARGTQNPMAGLL